jgi:hypothetical protein
MAWKATIPWVSSGAAIALGYLWSRRPQGLRAGSPRVSQGATPETEGGRLRDINLDPDVNLDRMARADALHDMGRLDENADFDALSTRSPVDFDADTAREPVDVDALDEVDITVGPNDHAVPADEPYDALDAEDVGTAWLRRATQAEPGEELDLNEALEGTHGIVDGEIPLDELERESAYGADQVGEPLSPYAGTDDQDVAAELPVGTLDSAGNAEFHAPLNPPDAFDAPPTGTLSPTDEEMARRDAAHAADQHRSRR